MQFSSKINLIFPENVLFSFTYYYIIDYSLKSKDVFSIILIFLPIKGI